MRFDSQEQFLLKDGLNFLPDVLKIEEARGWKQAIGGSPVHPGLPKLSSRPGDSQPEGKASQQQ